MSSSNSTTVSEATPLSGDDLITLKRTADLTLAIKIMNNQSAAYLSTRKRTKPNSPQSELDKLHDVISGFEAAAANLNRAITGHLTASSSILDLTSSDNLTIHSVRTAVNKIKLYSADLVAKISKILEDVRNQAVLEEMQCGCEKMKRECILDYVQIYKHMLSVLDGADADEKEWEKENSDFVGPKRAAFTSFFPGANELAREIFGA